MAAIPVSDLNARKIKAEFMFKRANKWTKRCFKTNSMPCCSPWNTKKVSYFMRPFILTSLFLPSNQSTNHELMVKGEGAGLTFCLIFSFLTRDDNQSLLVVRLMSFSRA